LTLSFELSTHNEVADSPLHVDKFVFLVYKIFRQRFIFQNKSFNHFFVHCIRRYLEYSTKLTLNLNW